MKEAMDLDQTSITGESLHLAIEANNLRPVMYNNDETCKLLDDPDLLLGSGERVDENAGRKIVEQNVKKLKRLQSSTKQLSSEKLCIEVLRSMSFLSSDDQRPLLDYVEKTYELLNSIDGVADVLQVTASTAGLRIIYDFRHDSVRYMDPTARSGTLGIYEVANKRMLFGAKGFLDNKRVETIYAMIAHEFTHFALNEVFRNSLLPYAVDDEANGLRFEQVFERCRAVCSEARQDFDVSSAFMYQRGNAQKRELAVKVPELLAFYHKDQAALSRIRMEFYDLFNYHTEVVVPALKAAIPVLKKLNAKTVEITYSELSEPMKAAIWHANVDFQGEKVKLLDLVDRESSKVFDALTSAQIRGILSGHVLVIAGKQKMEKNGFYFQRELINYDLEANDDPMDLPAESEESRTRLLSDVAGAGKSTTLKNLCWKLKSKLPSSWVAYIDLKQHLQVFQKFEGQLKSPRILSQAAQETCRRVTLETLICILAPANFFEIEIFESLFEKGRVVLLFDGLDEIAPKYSGFFLKLVESIGTISTNLQWIGSRPLYTDSIRSLMRCKVFKLRELNEDESARFLEKCLHSRFGVSEAEASLRKIQKVRQTVSFASSPLILKLLVEFGVGENLQDKNLNIFSVCEKIVANKMAIMAQKSFIEDVSKSKITFREVHQFFALKSIFSDELHDYLSDESYPIKVDYLLLSRRWKREKRNWTADAVSSSGLFYVLNWNSDNEQTVFVHRTFAEFFVAKFLIESVEEAFYDDDDLSHMEFNLRMSLAAFMLQEQCKSQSDFDGIKKLLADVLKWKNLQELQCSHNFLSFLQQSKLNQFINQILDDDSYDQFHFIADVIGSLVQISKFDEKVMSNLLLNIDRFSFLRRYFNKIDPNNSKQNHFDIFLGASKLIQLLMSQNFSLLQHFSGFVVSESYLRDVSITKFDFVSLELEDVEETQTATLFHQFLCFLLCVNSIPEKNLLNILHAFVQSLVLYVIRCKPIIEAIIKLVRTHFDRLEKEFVRLLSVLVSSFSENLIENSSYELHPQVLANFEHLILLVEQTSALDDCLVEKILRNKSHRLDCTTACSVLHCAIRYKSKIPVDFVRRVAGIGFIQEALSSVFPFDRATPDHLRLLNDFCASFLEFPTIFRVFLNKCSNLASILRLFSCLNLEENFKDQAQLTGYELAVKNSDEKQINFEISEKFASLFKFLSFLEAAEIPAAELEGFFAKHLPEILEFSLQVHDVLMSKLFGCLEKLRGSSIVGELMTTEMLTMKVQDLNVAALEVFDSRVSEILAQHATHAKKFKRKASSKPREQLHLLVFAVDHRCGSIVSVFTKCLSTHELASIFLQTDWIAVTKHENLTIDVDNFTKFLKFLGSNADDNSDRLHDGSSGFRHEREARCAKVLYELLSVVEKHQNHSKTELESFLQLGQNSLVLHFSAICSQDFADKLFDVYAKYFADASPRCAEFIRKGLGRVDFSPGDWDEDLGRRVAYFWRKTDDFFYSETLRALLLGDYERHHPLFVSVFYDIQFVQVLYIRLCTSAQILNVFVELCERHEQFLAKPELFARFFACEINDRQAFVSRLKSSIKSKLGQFKINSLTNLANVLRLVYEFASAEANLSIDLLQSLDRGHPLTTLAIIDTNDELDGGVSTPRFFEKVFENLLVNQMLRDQSKVAVFCKFMTRSRVTFSRLHQLIAVKGIAGSEKLQCVKDFDENVDASVFGLVTSQRGDTHFIHKPFNDYFVADFTRNLMLKGDEESALEDFVVSLKRNAKVHENSLKMLAHLMADAKDLYESHFTRVTAYDLLDDREKETLLSRSVIHRRREVTLGYIENRPNILSALRSSQINALLGGRLIHLDKPPRRITSHADEDSSDDEDIRRWKDVVFRRELRRKAREEKYKALRLEDGQRTFRTWEHLSEGEKQAIFRAQVMFQGFQVTFGELVGYSEEIAELLSCEQIDALLKGRTLSFFSNLSQPAKPYIERAFRKGAESSKTRDPELTAADDYAYFNKDEDEAPGDGDTEGGTSSSSDNIEEMDVDEPLGIVCDEVDLMAAAQASRFILISDSAGCGKTATLTNIMHRYKMKQPNLFVYYIDFKDEERRKELNERFDAILSACLPKHDLAWRLQKLNGHFCARECMGCRRLFRMKLERGDVVFLWDEVGRMGDVEAGRRKRFKCLVEMLANVRETYASCVQWVTVDEAQAGLFENLFKVESFRFVKISEDNNLLKFLEKVPEHERQLRHVSDRLVLLFQKLLESDNNQSSARSVVAFTFEVIRTGSIYDALQAVLGEFKIGGDSADVLRYMVVKRTLQLIDCEKEFAELSVLQLRENPKKNEQLLKSRIVQIYDYNDFEMSSAIFSFLLAEYFVENVLSLRYRLREHEVGEVELRLKLLLKVFSRRDFRFARLILIDYLLQAREFDHINALFVRVFREKNLKGWFDGAELPARKFFLHVFAKCNEIYEILTENSDQNMTEVDKNFKKLYLNR